ncbi:MAG TPA: type II toxin-antitoxin system VapC family toxin [Pirellulaceae bacterium]|jgi:predicted nucleic acid-binding protein
MESVYLETSFISYLVARPSRDVIVAGHQQTTQEWWANRRSEFECSISQVVIDEASVGDPAEVQKRLAIVSDLPALNVTEIAKSLAEAIMTAGILPRQAVRDAAHVAVCSVHSVAYLLTWNCKHLANAQITRRIELVCESLGHRMPIICTPEELMGV